LSLKRQIMLAAGWVAILAGAALALDPNAPAARMRAVKPAIAPPAAPVHDVRKYGAVGDGKTFDTQAIQGAIDACAGTGGSVLLSKGTFLTAFLTLKGGMTLYIAPDAVLLGGTKPENYPEISPTEFKGTTAEFFRRGLLFADRADKLIIDGGGTINGQGKFVQMTGNEPKRPSLLRIFHSTDVAVRNVTLCNARMWTQVYDHCTRLTVENLKVSCPPVCANLDGIDICDCTQVVVRNCRVESEDDGICLKSHSTGLKNILIENNTIQCYHANAIKIGTATKGPIEDLRILDNTVRFAKYGGVCIESVDGAAVRGVTVRGLDLYGTAQPLFVRLANRNRPGKPGSITDVTIEDVRILGTHGQTAPSCTITGIPDAKLGTVHLKNLYIEMPGGLANVPGAPPEKATVYPQSNLFGNTPAYGFFVRHAENVTFENVTIGCVKPDARPWLASSDAAVQTVECKDLKQIQPVKIP